MEKMVYERPVMRAETFAANNYVAACSDDPNAKHKYYAAVWYDAAGMKQVAKFSEKGDWYGYYADWESDDGQYVVTEQAGGLAGDAAYNIYIDSGDVDGSYDKKDQHFLNGLFFDWKSKSQSF